MVTKDFILKLFSAASIQRWNDKLRPVELTELDKQAHKMIIAYLLGKLEEKRNPVPWIEIIEGGIFELLQRIVVTDIKPQIYYMIKADAEKYDELNTWVFRHLKKAIEPLGDSFCTKYKNHFLSADDTLAKRILGAAHFYATSWEFAIVERTNPLGYEIREIKQRIQTDIERYYDLQSFNDLVLYSRYKNFIDLCGELRFQIRWSTTPRVPKTSVLGHMFIVAILAYLFSTEMDACESRCINNYFTGLFHDLPEVLTRDIISPVKRSIRGLDKLIKDYENQEMERNVYKLLDIAWHSDMRLYTEHEFDNILSGKRTAKTSDEINKHFNEDKYNCRDGKLVEAADKLAAFVECYVSLKHGLKAEEMEKAKDSIKAEYKSIHISNIYFHSLYASFK